MILFVFSFINEGRILKSEMENSILSLLHVIIMSEDEVIVEVNGENIKTKISPAWCSNSVYNDN